MAAKRSGFGALTISVSNNGLLSHRTTSHNPLFSSSPLNSQISPPSLRQIVEHLPYQTGKLLIKCAAMAGTHTHRPQMERRKTMTMNWAGLHDDDDEFFESSDRMSNARFMDLESDGEEEFDDARLSLSSVPDYAHQGQRALSPLPSSAGMMPDYNIWMTAPGSITERRKKLLQGMGLTGSKQVASFKRIDSVLPNGQQPPAPAPPQAPATVSTPLPEKKPEDQPTEAASLPKDVPEPVSSETSSDWPMFVRSRSLGEIDTFSSDRQRKEDLLGTTSKQRLTRTSSMIATRAGWIFPHNELTVRASPKVPKSGGHKPRHSHKGSLSSCVSNSRFGQFFLIKNLDTGSEFIVKGYDQDGMWSKLSDIQTGKQLTMEEFENCVGHSPVVKEMMRRENRLDGKEKMTAMNSLVSRSLRMSKRRGAAVLKSIKGVVSMKADKDKEVPLPPEMRPVGKNSNDGWVKVRQTGKSYKELTALHLCQEIQAHKGSIWTIRFSFDAKFLASAGEDKVIHIWEVQDCEVMSMNNEGSLTPRHPPVPGGGSPDNNPVKKKGKAKAKANPIPEYVHVPETVCTLSDKPICTLNGHQEDILDLSWSRSQQLLSSSMDKTVRLWDMESKSCLKMFAHNDYVTCIHFNPVDDNYFLSGSLDAKVRIWSVTNRQVVDWTDFHEMVTAACYAPDGQSAFIGSHKGSCRMFCTEDGKLEQMHDLEVVNKKKAAKKITGFQFSPTNPSEVLITSADSRVRIIDGIEVINKLRGLKNTESQIAASFSTNGKYIVSASEDSNVYVWRKEETRNATTGKRSAVITRAYEQFPCRDVSVAVTWPGSVKGDPPPMPVPNSKRNSKRINPLQAHTSSDSPKAEEDSVGKHNKKGLPPLPKKKDHLSETTPAEEDQAQPQPQPSQSEPEGTGDTSSQKSSSTGVSDRDAGDANQNASSPSVDAGDSSSPSPAADSNQNPTRTEDSSTTAAAAAPTATSWSAGWSPFGSPAFSWFDGHANQAIQPTAWGMVIVTATHGGEIRIYQNFGTPRKVGRQTPLF